MDISFSNCNFKSSTNLKNKPFKIENAQEIKELAKNIVRWSYSDHPFLDENYEKFIDLATDNPYFSQMALKHAEGDFYINSINEYINGNITQEEHNNKITKTRAKLLELQKSDKTKKLEGAKYLQAIELSKDSGGYIDLNKFKKYLNHFLKKEAVLAGLMEGSGKNLVPCSANKGIKIFCYKLLKLINNNKISRISILKQARFL